MERELLERLMSGKRPQNFKKGYAILNDGSKVTLDSVKVGGFEGKQGTVKRSRKGASRIQPNGTRQFIPGSPEVVAYIVR